MKSLKTLVDHLFAMQKTTTHMAVILTLAFGLVLGSTKYFLTINFSAQFYSTEIIIRWNQIFPYETLFFLTSPHLVYTINND